MTREDWIDLMRNGDSEAQTNAIALAVLKTLGRLNAGDTLGTVELVERIYPEAWGSRGTPEGELRQAVFKTVLTLAKTRLHGCCRKGEAVEGHYMGKAKRPWIWHGGAAVCPQCGQPLADI